MFKKNILLLICSISFAQETTQIEIEPIQTDRPDQTETSSLTPVKMFQIETGFSYQKIDSYNSEYVVPTVLWKYGVSEIIELRLITEFHKNESFNTYNEGISPVLIGCKIRISEENGILPKISLIGHLAFPNLAKTEYKNNYLAPEFRFAIQHTLSEKFSFGYNLGAEWDGFLAKATFLYTTALGYSITDKLGSYIELYGFAPEQQTANHNFDGGFTYLITNNFMIDASGGFGITKNAPDYFYALGFSFRI